MWKKHNLRDYLIPEAVSLPEATRIPSNVVYVPEKHIYKGAEVYKRKTFTSPVEVRDLNWNGRKIRVVLERQSTPKSTFNLVYAIFIGIADCFEYSPRKEVRRGNHYWHF